MSLSPNTAYPVWEAEEPKVLGGAPSLLAPYLTADGYWLYLAPNEVPAGATRGARVDSGAGYDVMLTGVSVPGLRPMLSPGGMLFILEG